MLSIEYVAGLLDGEGYIGIHKCKPQKRHKSISHSLQVYITNTYLGVLIECQKQFGGSIRKRVSPFGYKTLYDWIIATKAAAGFLSMVYPHLIIKRERARLAIEFDQTKSSQRGARLSKSELSLRESYYQAIHSLNQK